MHEVEIAHIFHRAYRSRPVQPHAHLRFRVGGVERARIIPSRLEKERKPPFEPIHSWINDCSFTLSLVRSTLENARSQFRR